MGLLDSSCCCVCKSADARSLLEVVLPGGTRTTLCGTHALMHRRSRVQARSAHELRKLFGEKRGRSERRHDDDTLGASLAAAFAGERRGIATDRRRA